MGRGDGGCCGEAGPQAYVFKFVGMEMNISECVDDVIWPLLADDHDGCSGSISLSGETQAICIIWINYYGIVIHIIVLFIYCLLFYFPKRYFYLVRGWYYLKGKKSMSDNKGGGIMGLD